jgi:hypothetical protein
MIDLPKPKNFWQEGDAYRISDTFFSDVRNVSQALRK